MFLPAYTLVLNSSVLPKRSKFLEEARQGQTLVINGGCFLFPLVLNLKDVHCKDLPQRHAIKASVWSQCGSKVASCPLGHWEEEIEMCTFIMPPCI